MTDDIKHYCIKEQEQKIKLCIDCGKPISLNKFNKRCKSCAGKIYSFLIGKKGKDHPCYGKCGEKNPMYGLRGKSNPNYGSKRTEETKINIGKAMRGKLIGNKNPRWIDGRSPLIHRIRLCGEYIKWRNAIFQRDKFICIICGDDRGGNLKAHHIIPLRMILRKFELLTLEQCYKCQDLWDINNGITLCNICHKDIHARI